MDLSIIIVNWNSKDYLRKCIDSIYATTHGIMYEVIVIENASFDGCGEMIKQDYPQVLFIQNNINVGFARANNIAFEYSQGNKILFLNPDTELLDSAIITMYNYLENNSNVGLVGCKLLNTDFSIQNSCIKSFPTVLNQLLDSEFLQRKFPHSRLWGMAPLYENSLKPVAVDAISGAFMLIKRSVFIQVGMFSSCYFMYSEDVDLCYKVHKTGLQNHFIPSVSVIHHSGKSSIQNPNHTFSSIMLMDSRFKYFISNISYSYGYLFRLTTIINSLFRLLIEILIICLIKSNINHSSNISTIIKWKARLRWAIGLEFSTNRFYRIIR